jgi:hypothetical protein
LGNASTDDKWDKTMFRLKPPTEATFFVSVVIAVIAVILHYAHIAPPQLTHRVAVPTVGHSNFVTLLLAYLVLLAGNLSKRLSL